MNKIKWGILGTGMIAKTFGEALINREDCELIAVGSRDLEKANLFKRQFNINKAYGSYEALVLDHEIDVIYIATPHHNHLEQTLLSLNHNKAVLCEKPITVNAQQANQVIQLAQEKGLFLMEAMWMKLNPTILKVKEWIKDGRIGELRIIKADFCFDLPYDPLHRLYNPHLAGGSLLDVGIYPITLASMMFNLEPLNIHSSLFIGKSHVDEQASIILDYGSGKQALLTSAISIETPPNASIHGTKGRIEIPNFFKAEEAHLIIGEEIELFHQPFEVNGYEYEIKEVNKCLLIKKMESDIHSLNDSLKIIKIMDQIRNDHHFRYPFESI